MRNRLSVVSAAAACLAAVSALGAEVNIRLEARGLGSNVQWSDISSGFILDVYLDTSAAMQSAEVTLVGDTAFAHAGTVRGQAGEGILNYDRDQGWDSMASTAMTLEPGNLPLPGGLNKELGTIAANQATGAWAGRFAWLEFTGVPPQGNYQITTGPGTFVSDIVAQQMTLISVTPLNITASSGDGGSGGGGQGGSGDQGNDDAAGDPPDDGDGGDTDPGEDGSHDDSVSDGAGDGTGTDDGGNLITPAPDGGDAIQNDGEAEQGPPPAPPAPCAFGMVEAAALSLLGLFFAQRRRR